MTNPGVIPLVSKQIKQQPFIIEDNIGESIHIHFGNYRVEMTINEFYEFEEQMVCVLNEMVGVSGFNARNFNPIHLYEQIGMYVDLELVKVDHVNVGELLTAIPDNDGEEQLQNIKDSKFSQALRGNHSDVQNDKQFNMYGENSKLRFESINESIQQNGYPLNNELIVLHNDGLFIFDGCHRASCILHHYGNITIPVLRLYFKQNKYSDEWVAANYKNSFYSEISLISKKMLVKNLLSSIVKDKKIALKGAGEHTRELIKLFDTKKNITCILSKNSGQHVLNGIDVVCDESIVNYDVDVVIISSYVYRHEMLVDLLSLKILLGIEFEIINLYELLAKYGCSFPNEFYRIGG